MTSQFGSYAGDTPRYHGTIKRSLHIPMRDGVRLAAEIVLPQDLPHGDNIPTLLVQTRYWRATELRVPFKWFLTPEMLDRYFREMKPFFTSHGYAIVTVDVRGTGASFGVWPHPWHRDSILDARDTVDWIIQQPWSDGQVGAYGTSYLGTTAELLVTLDHPAVKAVIPMFNHPDPYSDIAFPGGLFDARFIEAWGYFDEILDRNVVPPDFGVIGRLLFKGVKPVDGDRNREQLRGATRDHAHNGSVPALSQKITFRDEKPAGIDFCVDDMAVHRLKEQVVRSPTATCGWGSWVDAGTADAVIRRFLTFDRAQRGVIGAWEHGGRFNASPYRAKEGPPSPTLPQQWGEMLRFYDAYMKDKDNGVRDEKVLWYYTLGEETWHQTKVWPPEGIVPERWYLSEGNALSLAAPEASEGQDAYTVDFAASTGE